MDATSSTRPASSCSGGPIEHVVAERPAEAARPAPDRPGTADVPDGRAILRRCGPSLPPRRVPRPPDRARALRHRGSPPRVARRLCSSPTSPAIRRLAARMNADRPPGAPSVLGPARSRPWASSTRSATCSSTATTRQRGTPSMPAALAVVRAPPGADARPIGCSIASARRSPARTAATGAAGRPPRGAPPDPDRQREPGHRAAARARRRPDPRRGHALRGRRRRPRAGLRRRPAGRARRASSLVELMRAPARHAPTSLLGQLRYIR